jgi:hypothetical protein
MHLQQTEMEARLRKYMDREDARVKQVRDFFCQVMIEAGNHSPPASVHMKSSEETPILAPEALMCFQLQAARMLWSWSM